jgi:DNA polymerase III subunit delta'
MPLDGVLGQDDAIASLDTALASGRLHHAWIFHGPVGVGKFTTAMSFAAIALDPSSTPDLAGKFRPDPDSPTQARLAGGADPDLHIITKELARFSRDARVRDQKQRNIPLEVVKEFVIEPAGLKGSAHASLASKVFIIDEAQLLAREGQNALLKTLEEPPPGTLIILVTSASDRLLPTIRSRCSHVLFSSLADDAMQAWLQSSGLDVPESSLAWLLNFASGSPGQARLAIDTGLDRWREALDPMLDSLIAGRHPIVLGPVIDDLIKEWSEGYVSSNKNASKDAANKAAATLAVHFIASHLRPLLRDPASAVWAASAIEQLDECHRLIELNVRPVFAFENWAAQIALAPASAC